MYCKACGNKNPDDSNYCIKCGKSLRVSKGNDLTKPALEEEVENKFSSTPKINPYQKILILNVIFWFILSLFWIPYKSGDQDGEMFYDSFIQFSSSEVHVVKFLIQTFVLVAIFLILFIHLSKFKYKNPKHYSKTSRRSLLILVTTVLLIGISISSLYTITFFNLKTKEELNKEISNNFEKIEENSKRFKIRKKFVLSHGSAFDQKLIEEDYFQFWNYLTSHIDDPYWVANCYPVFKRQNDLLVDDWESMEAAKKRMYENYHSPPRDWTIKSPDELIRFIKEYKINEGDVRK